MLKKPKLDAHARSCYAASYSCLDCGIHFQGTNYRSHTSCISEDQKYQGKLYKEKKPKGQHQKKDSAYHDDSQALTAPHHAYVEDATEAGNSLAVVDAPPRAPTPPPAPYSLGYHEQQQAAIEDVNVFDFLEASETPNPSKTHVPADESRMIEDSQPPAYVETSTPAISDVMKFQLADDDDTFAKTGFSYGGEPVRPSRERYDSYATPAPKAKHSRTKSRDTDVETTTKKTDRKRKRNSPTQLDMSLVRAQEERDTLMSDAPPMLHSGLTGGLGRLLARPQFPPSPDDSGDYANSPLSPMKRAKQGNSKALLRAQQEFDVLEQKARKADIKARKEKEEKEKEKKDKKAKERGRERDRIERHASSALVKIRPKKKREDSGKEVRRIRRRQYSSSVSPAPQDRKPMKAIEYHRSDSRSMSPEGDGQLIVRPNGDLVSAATGMDPRADLFMSFITKGPESERGMSMNKALKRYHRERHDTRDRSPSKAEEEKELWKNLRLRRNDRGEVVLFFAPPEVS